MVFIFKDTLSECCNEPACKNSRFCIKYESCLLPSFPTSAYRKFLCTSIKFSAKYFSSIGNLLVYLERLQYIDLSHNNITELPDICKSMRLLRYIDVSHNKLSKFPEWILLLENVRTLKLGNNPLEKSFHPLLMKAQWKKIEVCCLENLNLINIPDCILYSNCIQYLSFGSSEKTAIWCQQNQLWGIPEKLPKCLKHLDLSNINLSSIDHDWKIHTQLEVFTAQGNDLFWLPDDFIHLSALRKCNLSSCGMFLLPEMIGYLRNLRVLILSSNKLTAIPSSCEMLVHLEILDLYDNQIETISCDFLKLSRLTGCDLWMNMLDPEQLLPSHTSLCITLRTNLGFELRATKMISCDSNEILNDEYEYHSTPESSIHSLSPDNLLDFEEYFLKNECSLDCDESWDDHEDLRRKSLPSATYGPYRESSHYLCPADKHVATQSAPPSIFPVVPGQFDDD